MSDETLRQGRPDALVEAPELLARYGLAVGLHMLASFLLVVAAFLFDSVWPHGFLDWGTLAVTAERWAETASRLALPVLAVVVGLLLPLYLAPLGSKELEQRAALDEDSLTAADHETLAIQDVRENLILVLATTGAVVVWWMLPAAVADPMFVLVVLVLAMTLGSLAVIREATFGRAAMRVLRSHRAHRGLTRLLAEQGVVTDADRASIGPHLRRARRLEWVLLQSLVVLVPVLLWLAASGLRLPTPVLDAGVVAVVVVPYLVWRWTGLRRNRIKRAKLVGSRGRLELSAASQVMAALIDVLALGVVYVIVHAAAESHLTAAAFVCIVGVVLALLVVVLPRTSRLHRLLLVDAALHARRRTQAPSLAPG